MAIKFSKVKLTAKGKSIEFLMGGVPLNKNDLNGWREYEKFLQEVDDCAKIQLNAQTYVYGEGDKIDATPEEVAYIMKQMENRPNFLQDRCQRTGSVNFNFALRGDSEIVDIKNLYPKGTRIMLVRMYDETHPIEMGTKGTVDYVDDASNIHMKWDNGRTLAICPEVDQFLKIDGVKLKEEDSVAEFGDDVFVIVSGRPVDCSKAGCFDEMEDACWDLVKAYCDKMDVKILPNEDGEIPTSYYIAKLVQDTILYELKEMGVKMDFDGDMCDGQNQEQAKTEEIKMGVMQ